MTKIIAFIIVWSLRIIFGAFLLFLIYSVGAEVMANPPALSDLIKGGIIILSGVLAMAAYDWAANRIKK